MVKKSRSHNTWLLTLRPNRSATWPQAKLVALGIGAVCLTIAIGWSIVGAWVILPFAGLESGLLFFLMYRVNQDTYRQQLLHLSDSEIRVQLGRRSPQREWVLKRHSTKVNVFEPDHPEGALRLTLQDRHTELLIGDFLNKEDSEETLRLLKDCGLKTQPGYSSSKMLA